MQKFARAALRNNNVDNCSRICHSPTQFGLSTTLGAGAASQHFDSILQADVILVVGANPTEGHPVFGSLMKRRVREGARLLVVDPRTHRNGQLAPLPRRRAPRAASRHERRRARQPCPRHRARGPVQRGVHSRPLQVGGVRAVVGARRRRSLCTRGRRPAGRHRRRRTFAAPRASTPPAPTAPSTTAWASRSTPRVDGRHVPRQPRAPLRDAGSRRRGRQPAARPGQRPGRQLSRQLAPHFHAATASSPTPTSVPASSRTGASRSTPSPACACRTCSTPRWPAPSRACTSWARTPYRATRTSTTSSRR